ncbi:late competence protein ComER [Allobacillus sp. GCM10007491]|uniref:Late competence protein ComER n=1 Tax=Allobacillus saliphilus TaxID=2912308 RepID=A0A941CVL7_9BACI|nr:late competence protein ComER [Allobacillus saliphilus]MBR7553351.1 late competence protein ComER [Allobacillus saliphilus]
MNWGIIGTGNMGKVLLHSFTTSHAVEEENLYLYNRTLMKAYELLNQYPNVHVERSLTNMANKCDVLLLCAKPKEILEISKKLQPHIKKEQLVISITSSISTDHLDQILPCKTARMIPSITNQSLTGATLLTFGKRTNMMDQQMIKQTCKLFSEPFEVKDDNVRAASDIVSCGPAFLSYVLEDMIQSVEQETSLKREEAVNFVETMVIGFGRLLEEKHFSLETLREKVMVKGGITGVGMEALEKEIHNSFNQVFKNTHQKFSAEKEMVEALILEAKMNFSG